MTGAEKLRATERREELFARAGYLCEVCGDPVRLHGTPQLAHRIPQTVANLRKYGREIIHHDFNLASVCSLRCNAAVLIDNNPEAKEALIDRILADIDG